MNPYAGTPLWARYYSEQMGWPVTTGVLDAADGPARCDSCGARHTRGFGDWDATASAFHVIERPLTLEDDYCFGCGAIVCEECVLPGIGPHQQYAHVSGLRGGPTYAQRAQAGA